MQQYIYIFNLKRKNYEYIVKIPMDKFHRHYLGYGLMVLKGSISNKIDLNKFFGFKRFAEKEKDILRMLENSEENTK